MSNPKPINARQGTDLIVGISVPGFNDANSTQAKDTNRNGRVDHNDRFISPDGQTLSPEEVAAILDGVCENKQPASTSINVSPEAQRTLAENGATISTTLVNNRNGGTTYQTLNLWNGTGYNSYGNYDPSRGACHYNKSGIEIGATQSPEDVTVGYTDADGPHEALLNLVTGGFRPVK